MRKGIAVSPGVAVGTAYCIHEIFVNPDTKRLEDQEVTAELRTLRVGSGQSQSAIAQRLQQKVARQVGHEAAAIFSVHEAILRDAAFTKKVRSWIVDDRKSAQAALHQLLEEYTNCSHAREIRICANGWGMFVTS